VDLVPPSLSTGTEISLSPCAKGDLSIDVVAVGKSKGEWCRSTDNGSGGGVLRSVAWAHEFVVGGRPWDDASQMCADSVKSVALDGLVFLDDDVSGISLKSLGKRTVLGGVGLKVRRDKNIVSKGILGSGSSSSSSGTWGDEEGNVWDGKSSNSDGGRSDKDKVHQVTTVHIDVKLIRSGHTGSGGESSDTWGRGKGSGRAEGKEGSDNREKLHGV